MIGVTPFPVSGCDGGSGQVAACSRCHKAVVAASHPVGVRYGATKPRRGRGRAKLRAKSLLDKRNPRFDGKVGCASCHNVYSRSKNLLVMENRRGRLCLACHDM